MGNGRGKFRGVRILGNPSGVFAAHGTHGSLGMIEGDSSTGEMPCGSVRNIYCICHSFLPPFWVKISHSTIGCQCGSRKKHNRRRVLVTQRHHGQITQHGAPNYFMDMEKNCLQ